VQVRSKGLGCGSEFIVLLPMLNQAKAVKAAAPLQPHPAARVCRVLVIEDSADANEMLNYCLTLDGHSVSSAFDGPSGLAMAQDGNYDIVICDLGLPGMDGFEVLRQLRRSGALPVPYCIAMTGYDTPAYHRKAQEVGFDNYLVKPVTKDRLQDVMSKIFPVTLMN
jgi:two-component system CheB/CheR fusion protein